MGIHLIAALMLLPLVFGIPGDDISGDYLEHFIVYPLTHHIPLRKDPVQSLHIALDGDNQVKVVWLTPHINFNNTFQPTCFYGITSTHLDHQVLGEAFTYIAGMFQLTLNLATINLSKVTQKYDVPIFYICGDPKYGWSNETYFTFQPSYVVDPILNNQHTTLNKFDHNVESIISMHQSKNAERYESPRGSYQKTIALIGDMGVTHDENTAASIKSHIDSGHVQMIVHAGDISYADNFDETHHNNSYIWVEYMYNIQNLTARVPYMTAPGNHEAQFRFAAYLNWFKMPCLQSSSLSPFWYSFDYMGVHFTAYSSEHNFSRGSKQNEWIAADLEKAHGNRANVPWLFIFGHRPLYCTAEDDSRCIRDAAEFRLNIEDLLYKYEVSMWLLMM